MGWPGKFSNKLGVRVGAGRAGGMESGRTAAGILGKVESGRSGGEKARCKEYGKKKREKETKNRTITKNSKGSQTILCMDNSVLANFVITTKYNFANFCRSLIT